MDDIGHPMHHHPSTPFLRPILIAILRTHLLHRKIAIFILESTMIQCKELTEYLALNLFHKVVDSIAIDECPLLCVMCMQVEVERKSIVPDQVIGQFLYGIDCRLL